MSNYPRMESDDWEDVPNKNVQPKRIAIAKLIAACYLDQEAALLSAVPIQFDNPEDAVAARRILEKIKARLKSQANKLRSQ